MNKDYKDNYTYWKNWKAKDFGLLSNIEESYFNKELKKTQLKFSNRLNVLELGFGNGSFLTFCIKKKWDISGIEVNENLVSLASKKGINAKNGSLGNLFEDKSFDLIVAFDVLEHLTCIEIAEILKSMKKKLKSNGVILARFPNGDSPLGLKYQNGDITHKTFIGSDMAKYFANSIGGEIISLQGQETAINFNWTQSSIIKSVTKYIMLLIRKFTNILLNAVFYDGSYKYYTSSNLVLILKIK